MNEGENAGSLHERGTPSDWIVDTRVGIENLLEAIVRANRPARVTSRMQGERASVRFLEIDSVHARIVFVPLSALPMHTWLSAAREIVFSTDHDGVPIEFECQRPTRIVARDAEAYAVGFPGYILRLQRRNAYRLPAPSIACTLRDESGHGADITPRVLDVSAGGLDLSMPLDEPPLSRDASYSCTIVLPALGTVWVRVQVISVFLSSDARRYGCQFLDLPAASELLLQRYILEEQRARRRSRPPREPKS